MAECVRARDARSCRGGLCPGARSHSNSSARQAGGCRATSGCPGSRTDCHAGPSTAGTGRSGADRTTGRQTSHEGACDRELLILG
jgi:hypothetical protein